MKTVFVVAGCLLAGIRASVPAQEVRIATVDVSRVLEGFPPWQEEMCRQDEERGRFTRNQKENAERKCRYEALCQEWIGLKKQADDKANAKAERQKADKAAAALLPELQELDRLLPRRHGRDWGTPEQMFNEALAQRRWEILKEVQKTVSAVADREPYQFVFDTSPRSDGGGGGLLWANPAKFRDISLEVLTELNRREEVKQLYAAVNSAKFFAVGAVGETGEPSEAETALRKLLGTPDATEQCRLLMSDGKPAGRLYGFLGLKLLKEKGWPIDDARITKDRNTINVMRGRRRSEHYVGEIAKQIAQGKLK